MELTVHGKQMDVGDALRTHVQEKLEDISEKYFNQTVYATVTFSQEGHGHKTTKVNIKIKLGKNIIIIADAKETDAYVAFDSASEKAAKQLRRYKRKLRDHHARQEQSPEAEIIKARDYVLAATPEAANEDDAIDDGVPTGDDPLVIAEMTTNIETMSVSDAVMRMDLSSAPVMLFRNASNDVLNIVYRRDDGNVGWIDPENQIKSA